MGKSTEEPTAMDVSLTPNLEQFIQAQVESGRFSSALEVIEAGLRLLDERDRLYQGRFEELRQAVLIGVEQLDRGEQFEGRAAIAQLRERNQTRKAVQS
ncbi:type II toxin-antitoxin system ParD family antitoxin [Microcoleus sp. FACHB-1515]|uniref:type II toxin-antitoxin system ParD family antitoxin n=1 Tax=Cyanophyceae TaxID=3028117 RepID=UPI001F554805|nr:type II toxin-antitoxin system ParD family antitoxin [Microcoleus sp. FACHB-1515]